MEITIRIVSPKIILAAAAGCVLLTAALACGGGSNSTNTPTAAQSQSGSSAATATATAAATEQAASSTTASSNVSASGPLAVCALITQDEIVSIVGLINAGLPNSISPTEYACEWHAAPAQGAAVGVGVHLNTTVGARAYFQATNGVDEAGIGDGARWDASQTTLHVLKGKYVLDISALGLASASASLAAAEAIAQVMMPRLP